jgi:hypothetical protein
MFVAVDKEVTGYGEFKKVWTRRCCLHYHGGMADELQSRLEAHVRFLAGEVGVRSYDLPGRLDRAADYIEEAMRAVGLQVTRQPFRYGKQTFYNVIGEAPGELPAGEGFYVVGAHYDTVQGSPGADDNASGVAGMLELARLTAERPLRRAMRFVGFSLEEPPVFRSSRMGSMAYAQSLREEAAPVLGMVSLEMIGYYCHLKGCQFYPLRLFRLFFPRQGDFIAFVGDVASRRFTRQMKALFAEHCALPAECLNAVRAVPGVDFSDHYSFWKNGYRAFMVTDTAFYRNPYYHAPGDTPDTLDYARMAEVVRGLYKAFEGGQPPF